jgi:hypothetical protein
MLGLADDDNAHRAVYGISTVGQNAHRNSQTVAATEGDDLRRGKALRGTG